MKKEGRHGVIFFFRELGGGGEGVGVRGGGEGAKLFAMGHFPSRGGLCFSGGKLFHCRIDPFQKGTKQI